MGTAKPWHVHTIRGRRWIVSTRSYHEASMVSRAMCEAGVPCKVSGPEPMTAKLGKKVVQIIR